MFDKGGVKLKRILVVGNGFDLAHGLPTKYSDFLYFMVLCINATINIHELKFKTKNDVELEINHEYDIDRNAFTDILKNSNSNERVQKLFVDNREYIKVALDSEFKDFIDNDLLTYLICVYAFKQELACDFQWIDIEYELMTLLNNINQQRVSYNKLITFSIPYRGRKSRSPNTFTFHGLNKHLGEQTKIPADKLKSEFFEYLFDKLEQFSALLKFYLKLVETSFHSDNKKIFQLSPKINDKFYVSHIISFNYTDLSTIYNPNAEIYYVNGSLSDSNIILGVENQSEVNSAGQFDDGLPLFFKNVQRVWYDFQYKHNIWLQEPAIYNKNRVIQVRDYTNVTYIIGHSLTETDKQILLDIIEHSDAVTIFYYNDSDKRSKITNLYKILGDEKFYRYINNDSASPKIALRHQSKICT